MAPATAESIKPRDICVVGVARTPMGGFLGSLSSVSATKLGSIAIAGAIKRANIDPALVEEVFFGNVLSANLGQAPARQAALGAGIPNTVICTTVNKVCASGMKATMLAAQSIQLGINDVVVAGGMENMSNVPKYFTEARKGSRLGHDSLVDGMLKDGLTDVYNDCGMGVCAEICAENHKITREDQYDVYGNLFGLLASHPIAPLVTLHHLDVVEPIFPNVTRVQALQRLTVPMKLDSAGLMQQSICYDKANSWTISVSWGFAVQIFRGVLSPREMEMPSRTFLNWYKRADYTAYAFNTRPVARNPCQKPFVFYLSSAKMDPSSNQTVSQYSRHRVPHPACKWKTTDPADVDRVQVYKKPDPHLWDRSPRRNCCRVLSSKGKNMVVDVGVCKEGELSEV